MTTNMPQVVREIYLIKMREGKKVKYNERLQCVTEFYEGKKSDEIAEIIDNEVKDAFKKGYQAFRGVR